VIFHLLEYIFDGTTFFSVDQGLPQKAVVIEDKKKSYNVSCVGHINITLDGANGGSGQLSQALNVVLKQVCFIFFTLFFLCNLTILGNGN
jgi:hypothetical protein